MSYLFGNPEDRYSHDEAQMPGMQSRHNYILHDPLSMASLDETVSIGPEPCSVTGVSVARKECWFS